jgi:RHH-type proline utilization regulon transcriptional repressor/proline dehydrogenase/delta 1-pyrroline-5-carboxylate dehydrogenase
MTASSQKLDELRKKIRDNYLPDESQVVPRLAAEADLSQALRADIVDKGVALVRRVREHTDPGIMESFLAEYGLSTKEGVALMCLAEALLRVPDAETIDALIEDKIAPSEWGKHLGHSSSSLVNASTWALLLTGKVLSEEEEGLVGTLRAAVKRLGEPVIRTAVGQALKELGRQFVLGRTIEEAMEEAKEREAEGYSNSFDMLGEAARTEADAKRYHLAYSEAISELAANCKSDDIRVNPGISVKLSALHPRYEFGELVPRAQSLALLAKSANMGFNIDAEEADRLDLSLDVIEALLSNPALKGWDGFGVVVQAYGPRGSLVVDWLYALAESLDRRIMVRLVKGAYWDTEIKRAQVMGLASFPVFTRKISTDISYISCARKLLGMTDRIYPQFATHNAHTAAAVLLMGDDRDDYEFQRLHGMGESLHDIIHRQERSRCRIYAPVGAHRDLLAYLVRRLLENGANSSFVNQIVDENIRATEIARDPFEQLAEFGAEISNPKIAPPAHIFGAGRRNARGWDITDVATLAGIEAERAAFRKETWDAKPLIAGDIEGGPEVTINNPSDPNDIVGKVTTASAADVECAVAAAATGLEDWSARSPAARAEVLRRLADLYEIHAVEFFALAAREAGKTLLDGVAEVREAVDFLRYYADEAERIGAAPAARGIFACISPWNFPLAIFTGQIAAALAAGNAVLAKPAEQTPLIACKAVSLMHEAGMPAAAIQLLPGDGAVVGAALSRDSRLAGICFTGSTETAQLINRAMAGAFAPEAPLIAETGGLNAMIVDSTALPEQAVRDIIASAFQSAGQRCSALRMLYLQEDVADRVLEMLIGAMAELRLGDPWDLSSDVGPVIDEEARAGIEDYVARFEREGRVLLRLEAPEEGRFVPPTLLKVSGIEELSREVFGPVLHVATFEADEIDAVVAAVNAKGYGLTFGLHTRIDDRVQQIVEGIEVGNIYVNRNQIGAVVGSQPFGGEGLSGTGPKAGGPAYVRRFLKSACRPAVASVVAPAGAGGADEGGVSLAELQVALESLPENGRTAGAGNGALTGRLGETLQERISDLLAPRDMPGPTGESNRLTHHPRGRVLCLGPGTEAACRQAELALALGNAVLLVAPGAQEAARDLKAAAGSALAVLDGVVASEDLTGLRGLAAVVSQSPEGDLRALRRALAARDGMLVPLIAEAEDPERFLLERLTCIDTTAAGGNASLLASAEG